MASFARTPYGAYGPEEIISSLNKGELLQQPAQCSAALYALMRRFVTLPPSSQDSLVTPPVLRFATGAGAAIP